MGTEHAGKASHVGRQLTCGDARPRNGMAKAILLETQSLGPKSRGVRKLDETHTEAVYGCYEGRHPYSPTSPQRIGDAIKGRTGA